MNKNIEELLDEYIGCETNCVGAHEVSLETLEQLVIAVAQRCRDITMCFDATITEYFGLDDE